MRKPGFILVFLFCLLVAAAGGCSLWSKGPQSSPQKLAEAYMEAFKNSDFEGMLNLSTGWTGGEEELAFTRRFFEMIELQSYEIGRVEQISDSEALVEISSILVLFGQERAESHRVKTIKKDGKWYMDKGLLD